MGTSRGRCRAYCDTILFLVRLQARKQAWGTRQFQQYIGKDVTSLLSLPVWIMEPFTILQKAAEIKEYTELLDTADKCEDPYERWASAEGWDTAAAVRRPVPATQQDSSLVLYRVRLCLR